MDTQTNQQLQIFIIKHKDGKKEQSKYLSHDIIFDDNSIISMFGRFFFSHLSISILMNRITSERKRLAFSQSPNDAIVRRSEREKLFK